MLKKLLYLYNDGHNPFPHTGKGGLGYHLPHEKLIGGRLIRYVDENDRTDILDEYDDGDSDDEILEFPIPNTFNDEGEPIIKSSKHYYPNKTGNVLYHPETKEVIELVEYDEDGNLLPLITKERRDRLTYEHQHPLEAVNLQAEKITDDLTSTALKEAQTELTQEEFIIMDSLKDKIKNISREKSIGYGVAFEDYLVNPKNSHILNDTDINFTSSLSDDNPILETKIILGGKLAKLKDVIVYDLFSDDCIYEIKNFGMSTRNFNAESYEEIINSDNPFIEIQCSKIIGNPDFIPTYVAYNDGSFKIYNIECKRNNQFILPEKEKGRDFKIIVMLKNALYEYNPFDDIFEFEPKINKKGKREFLTDDSGSRIGQIYKPCEVQPFKTIVKNGQNCYKLDINKFKNV